MYYYYIFTLFTSMLFFLNKSAAYYFILLAVPIFLYLLPSTGLDYEFYKLSYDSAQLAPDFPYSTLSAEPFYIWYTSFISIVTAFRFPLFLFINFIIFLFVFLILIDKFINIISKLYCIQDDTLPSDFKLTSILSILIYPVFLLYLIKTLYKTKMSKSFLFLFLYGEGGLKDALVKLNHYIIKVFIDEDEVVFKYYLVKFDLYIRPALEDGFSIACADAVDFGHTVIASNVCKRYNIVKVYSVDNVKELFHILERV